MKQSEEPDFKKLKQILYTGRRVVEKETGRVYEVVAVARRQAPNKYWTLADVVYHTLDSLDCHYVMPYEDFSKKFQVEHFVHRVQRFVSEITNLT